MELSELAAAAKADPLFMTLVELMCLLLIDGGREKED